MTHEFSDGAIDALIAASLRQKYTSDTPSEENIEAAIKAASINDPEDAERLQRIRNRLNQKSGGAPASTPLRKSAGPCMAMNRKHDQEEFCESTQQALEEARRKALEELLKEEKEGGSENDNI
jgi:hypothetical protein